MAQPISVRVPATSANLGCLFDCAALALSLYLDIRAIPREGGLVTVRYRGATPERVPTDASNLIARTLRETLRDWGKSRGFELEIENQIPVGVGLGSSAAAIVGALVAAHRLAGVPITDTGLVSMSAHLERHPDNVAAAWHGGFTVAAVEDGRVLATSCPVPESFELVVVVPDYALPTEKARAVLPTQVSHSDAVHNVQRAAVLAAQLFSGKGELLPSFFDDRLHQPYRASLVPGLSDVLKFTHPDLAGLCLSGAGPSLLAFARQGGKKIGEAIRSILATRGIRSQSFILAPDNRGAKGWNSTG